MVGRENLARVEKYLGFMSDRTCVFTPWIRGNSIMFQWRQLHVSTFEIQGKVWNENIYLGVGANLNHKGKCDNL